MKAKNWLVLFGCITASVRAETLTLPISQRPDWLARDGIVMAGSWEPLLFRVRRDGSDGYTPSAEQLAAYAREHSPEMVDRLKAIGVNFVMMHCYKGAGLQAERQSMADAVAFSKLCHKADMRVGVYNYSGAFIWELFFKEVPHARDWLILDADAQPVLYGQRAKYRYFWNRNHPDAQAFYRGLVKFAVEDIQTDLVHLDNHNVGPGSEPVSAERFRRYLASRFTPTQLQGMGIADLSTVQPPLEAPTSDPLRRAWLDFTCRSLADAYAGMTRYARSLRRDILMECNPGGPGHAIRPPVDHGRLLQGGEAFWDEGGASGYHDGRLHSRIRTYKIGRAMGNMAFAYTTTPIEAAEAMAFNLDCLGCICWFEYGKIVARPGSDQPVSPELARYVEFFHQRRDLLGEAEVVADVAVLRSFPSQVFGEPNCANLTALTEEQLIRGRLPFRILYDHQLGGLERYQVLVLAGCTAMSDDQIRQVRRFVQHEGRLCLVGPTATHDEWMLPRKQPGLEGLPKDRVLRLNKDADLPGAVRKLWGERLALSVEAPPGVCVELTRQPERTLVHLVNYRPEQPAESVHCSLRLTSDPQAMDVYLVSPDEPTDQPVPHERRGRIVSFEVPTFNVYAIAVVQDQAGNH